MSRLTHSTSTRRVCLDSGSCTGDSTSWLPRGVTLALFRIVVFNQLSSVTKLTLVYLLVLIVICSLLFDEILGNLLAITSPIDRPSVDKSLNFVDIARGVSCVLRVWLQRNWRFRSTVIRVSILRV